MNRFAAVAISLAIVQACLPGAAVAADVEAWSGSIHVEQLSGGAAVECPLPPPSRIPVRFAWTRDAKGYRGYAADDLPRARQVEGAALDALSLTDPEYRYLQFVGTLSLREEAGVLTGTLRAPPSDVSCAVAVGRVELRRDLDGAPALLERLRGLHEASLAALRGMIAGDIEGKWSEALRSHREALEQRLARLGPRHQDTIRSRINVGHALVRLGRLADAEPLAREALETASAALGEHHPDTRTARRNLAALLEAQGRHAEAVPLRATLHAGAVAAGGERSPAAIDAAHEWAFALDRAGRPAEALPVNRRNAELAAAVLGESHRSTLWARHNAAANLADLGRADEALDQHRDIGARRARAFGEADPDTLWSRYAEALALLALKRTDEAAALLERVIEGRGKALGPDAPDTLWARRELANARRQQSRHGEALAIDRAIVASRARTLGPDHPDTLSARVDVGLDLRLLGRTQEAVSEGEAAANGLERVLGPSHPASLAALHALGYHYYAAGRPAERLSAAQRVLERRQRALGDDHPLTLEALEALAGAHMAFYQYDIADPLLQRAVAARRRLSGDSHPETLRLRGLRGALLGFVQGRAAEGIAETEAVWQLVEANPALPEPFRLEVANQLAFAYLSARRHADDLRMRRSIAAIAQRLHGPAHPEALRASAYLANALSHAGQHDAALERARRAAEQAAIEHGADAEVALDLLVNRMAIEDRARVPLAEKERTIALLVGAMEQRRASGDASDEARRALFRPFSLVLMGHAAELAAGGHAERAFELVERAKARTLLDSLALRRADENAGLAPIERERLRALEERRAALDEKLAAAAPEERLAARAARDEAVRELGAYRRTLEAAHPRYAQLREVRIATAREGADLLAADQAFVSYLWESTEDGTARRLAAFVLTRAGLRHADLGSGADVEKLVHALRALLSRAPGQPRTPVWQTRDGRFVVSEEGPAGATEVQDPRLVADALASRVLQPLKPLLAGQRRLVVSPAGPLALVPFEALPLDGELLVARHDVSYVQSLSVLRLLAERERESHGRDDRRPLFAMGAPVYEPPQPPTPPRRDVEAARNLAVRAAPGDVSRAFGALGMAWSELPGAEREVADVAALFPEAGRTTLLRADASEAKLRELDRSGELAKYRYLHFAAHGYLSTQVPALSSLVLSQVGNAPGTDGYVTAAEWTAFNLASDLIVLSACDTGVGEVVHGEGIMGLPYALFAAGNRNTLLTLWPIVDATTAEFMKKLFARLAKGEPQSRALAETKREFLAGPLARPVYWAGFVLYGN